jgi:hypothetical protein
MVRLSIWWNVFGGLEAGKADDRRRYVLYQVGSFC